MNDTYYAIEREDYSIPPVLFRRYPDMCGVEIDFSGFMKDILGDG